MKTEIVTDKNIYGKLEEGDKLEKIISLYNRRLKLASIGKHSTITYKISGLSCSKDVAIAENIIKDRHGDSVTVFFATKTNDMQYAIVLPKSGHIGVSLNREAVGIRGKESSMHKQEIGSDIMFKHILNYIEYYDYSTFERLDKIRILAFANGKTYDITKTKLMLSKNRDKDLAYLTSHILFGLEQIGAPKKWTFEGYELAKQDI